MKKLLLSLALLVSLTALAGPKKKEGFKIMHVEQVSDLIALHAPGTTILDANNAETRAKYGVIPGAQLLPSSKNYDTAKLLPNEKDAPVVFYCANPKCMSSHEAADLAVKAGYENVNVMTDGIQGWVKAGKQVMRLEKNP